MLKLAPWGEQEQVRVHSSMVVANIFHHRSTSSRTRFMGEAICNAIGGDNEQPAYNFIRNHKVGSINSKPIPLAQCCHACVN
ncbi:hypothetical protein I3842_11G127600 [Carya illinoinensis]|uniref:Uncharacterized protein n=1 Tax=Carya illinoinensis TaxID=32201 RepID=A0A922IZA0_CARIL|nr:hypothetical protein I3842_11G127600 [Carya illinoinensis]KAG6688491.1 hypothetical protein I3842_11G127600 [Carya illinoinensis]